LLDTLRPKTDSEAMIENGYGRDTYQIAKKEAIIRFGIALHVEVEKQTKQSKGG